MMQPENAMLQFQPLIARFSGVPALIAEEHSERAYAMLAMLAAEPRAADMLREAASSDDGFWPDPDSWKAAYRPYVVQAGILFIPVKGLLLNEFSFAVGNSATGYVYIRRALERGLADQSVKGIAFVCNSPGGEVAGCFDLVDRIFAARGQKPMRGFAHEGAYSAGYAVISATDSIVVSRTGGVGSIGTLTMHVDVSKAYSDAGFAITLIDAPKGGHKTDGSPFKPLSADALARMQARIDYLYGIFVGIVARNRKISEQAVRDTQALTYTADQAKSIKLADAIGALDDAVAAFAADLSSNEGDEQMSTQTTAAAATAATFTQADLDRVRAEGQTSGKAEGIKLGAAGERARIAAILDHAEAQGREPLARHFAFKTEQSAETAVEALKAASKMEATAADPLAALTEQANVTLGAAPAKTTADASALWSKSVTRTNKARGF